MCICFSWEINVMSTDVPHHSCLGSQIINLGTRLTDFGTASLKIHWPKETENGKWLLYLMNIHSTGVENIDCTPKNEFNSLYLVSKNIMLMCGGCSACLSLYILIHMSVICSVMDAVHAHTHQIFDHIYLDKQRY